MMTLPFGEARRIARIIMRVKDPLTELLYADCDFLASAGPAVLRLKLLEATHLAASRRLPDDVRAAAREAADELRRLICERPCVSLIDHEAKQSVARRHADCA